MAEEKNIQYIKLQSDTQKPITSCMEGNSEKYDDTDIQIQQKPKKASLRAATFGMMAGALGTGIFNLPFRVNEVGILPFIFYVAVGGCFSYVGCYFLQVMIMQKGYENFSEICFAASGNPLKRLVQFSIIAFPWGIAICKQVLIPKFIIQLLSDSLSINLITTGQVPNIFPIGQYLHITLNIIVLLIIIFLLRKRDMTMLQQLSTICVSSALYNAFAIFITLFIGFVKYDERDGNTVQFFGVFRSDWTNVHWVQFGFLRHLQAIASILYSYVNHQLVFPTCRYLENPTKQRLLACFFRSNLGELCLQIVIALSGYLLLVPHENIFPISSMVLASINFWPVTVGKVLLIITLLITTPLNLFPARTILRQSLNLEDTTKNHYILTLCLCITSCIVAILFVGVNSYFGLLGGTCGVLIGGIIPAWCFWKLVISVNADYQNWTNYAQLCVIAVISPFAMIGGILSIVE